MFRFPAPTSTQSGQCKLRSTSPVRKKKPVVRVAQIVVSQRLATKHRRQRREGVISPAAMLQHFSLAVMRFHLFGTPLSQPKPVKKRAQRRPEIMRAENQRRNSVQLSAIPLVLERRLLNLFGSVKSIPLATESALDQMQRRDLAKARVDEVSARITDHRKSLSQMVHQATKDPLRVWKSTAALRWAESSPRHDVNATRNRANSQQSERSAKRGDHRKSSKQVK